ncbi:major capsid protein [Streptomyces sp. NPDC006477]|uniref:major capsid protein n=1 Tax=Streptomyces sp. NPDC006477 TaxID=3364747 RepID=UPI0036889850
MPNITPGDVHVNQPLTQLMVSYYQSSPNSWIADRVFPNIPVQQQTDFYYKMGRRSFLQSNARKRAPSTETPGTDWNFTKDTFRCDTWGLHHDIEDQLRANADSNFQLDATGTELITQQMLLRREMEWHSKFFKSGVWAADLTGIASGTPTGNQFLAWNNTASSPIETFQKLRREFHLRTGIRPNFAVFGTDAWDALLLHPEIIERVKYTQAIPGEISPQLIANALQIRNIYVSEAVEAVNTDEELVADPVPQTEYVADTASVLVGFAPPRASVGIPSAGYTFSWNGYLGASAFGGRVKRFRMESIASDRIEIEASFDFKIVAPELGTYLQNAVAV